MSNEQIINALNDLTGLYFKTNKMILSKKVHIFFVAEDSEGREVFILFEENPFELVDLYDGTPDMKYYDLINDWLTNLGF